MNNAKIDFTEHEISNILNSKKNIFDKRQEISTRIMELLTTRSGYFEEIQKGTEVTSLQQKYTAQAEWYRKQQSIYENHKQGDSNPGWIQMNCTSMPRPATGINIKIYRTFPVAAYLFIAHLAGLKTSFELLSAKTQDPISFKFPRGLLSFLKHPDSLVIHFQKKENIQVINQILETWMCKHSIFAETRELGRTELAADHNGMSFSELIAWNFSYQILRNPQRLNSLLESAIQTSQVPNFRV